MAEKGTIFIVEDEGIYREHYQDMLLRQGYHVKIAADLKTAGERLGGLKPEVVLLDLRFPPREDPEEGLAFLEKIRLVDPFIKVIVVTGVPDRKIALKAIDRGAYDFVEKKGSSHAELPFRVNQAFEKLQLERELVSVKQDQVNQIGGYFYGPGQLIVGTSEKMGALYRQIDQIASTDATVLITGETGTGKELIARAIHYRSPRRHRPVITVDCGVLPPNVIESELFGHVRGAFTDALRDKKGLFEEASGSTLFLDEIGDLPPSSQGKFLRAIQEGEIRRVGDNLPIQVDIRSVAATNKDLERAIEKGEFREDLWYRISVVQLVAPPLRERQSDIPMLAEHFLRTKAAQHGKSKSIIGFREGAMDVLMSHSWPGNVRQLEIVIERTVIFDEDGWISADDIKRRMKIDASPSPPTSLPDLVASYEKSLILNALKRSHGVQTQAASILGIPKGAIRSKMKRLGLA